MLFKKSVSEIRNLAVNRQKSEEENMVDDMVHTTRKNNDGCVFVIWRCSSLAERSQHNECYHHREEHKISVAVYNNNIRYCQIHNSDC